MFYLDLWHRALKVIMLIDLVWRLVTDCTIEPDNKHSNNAILDKSGNDDIVGHVPETLAKKLFNFMKSQQIGIMDSEVTGNPRPAPDGK